MQKFKYVQFEKIWIYYSVQDLLSSRLLSENLKFKIQLKTTVFFSYFKSMGKLTLTMTTNYVNGGNFHTAYISHLFHCFQQPHFFDKVKLILLLTIPSTWNDLHLLARTTFLENFTIPSRL